MTRRKLTFFLILIAVLSIPLIAWLVIFGPDGQTDDPFKLSDRLAWLDIDGSEVVFEGKDGTDLRYSAEEFIAAVEGSQGEESARPPAAIRRILNLTSWKGLFWVSIGLLGQALFTGRMVIQWLTSEREKRSVVPVSFWWLSLAGASMNIIYFLWRADAVGILGQSTGWFVYLRNLWLIYSVEASKPDS